MKCECKNPIKSHREYTFINGFNGRLNASAVKEFCEKCKRVICWHSKRNFIAIRRQHEQAKI